MDLLTNVRSPVSFRGWLTFLKRMLGGRIASGAALAGLPLALALTAAAQSWQCWIVTLGAVLVALVVVLTLAPWIPLLYKIPPPVGAPRVRITFRQVPEGEHRYPESSVIVEVGVKPTTRLDDAVVNFQFPTAGLGHPGVRNIDPPGRAEGSILPPPEITTSSPILWWNAPDDIRAASRMYHFQLTPTDSTRPQTFKVTMLVSSEKLHSGESSADFEVNYRPATPVSPRVKAT